MTCCHTGTPSKYQPDHSDAVNEAKAEKHEMMYMLLAARKSAKWSQPIINSNLMQYVPRTTMNSSLGAYWEAS